MEDTIKYRGHIIKILQDENPMDPREYSDHLGIMACSHKRYSIGDSNHGVNFSDFTNWYDVETFIRRKLKGVLVMPIYMYDHSGQTISTRFVYPYNDQWDAGQIGFIFTTKARIREWYGKKLVSKTSFNRACKMLEFEIQEYDQWMRGDVYGYVIEDKQGNEVESVWGFYGTEYCLKEAKGTIDCIKDGVKNGNRSYDKQAQAKKQIRDKKGRFIKAKNDDHPTRQFAIRNKSTGLYATRTADYEPLSARTKTWDADGTPEFKKAMEGIGLEVVEVDVKPFAISTKE